MESPKSKFLKVKCKKCRNEQIIFNKTATVVKCLVCESVLAEPTGGLAEIKTKIEEVMD
ncbi:MAG TPA: 30S ribosomal protein S27e [Candidatus Aenigmarchaeota archaeon]|nr:30S ribosomal protein S27e [Candidatus Aenigmarchaeota archaeon]HLD39175.1 30S ribosomal protein S27e [archaeon]